MAQLIICPSCGKTVAIESGVTACPGCGHALDMQKIMSLGLVIDAATEAKEFAVGKDYFVNTEFLSASEHFAKALEANKNSYLSQYFVLLCAIYLNDQTDNYDVMSNVLKAIKEPLGLLHRSNVSVNDKLNFVSAILNETKIIITNRLRSHESLFELNIAEYRKKVIADLQTLLALFKIDDELMMTYAPGVRAALSEIADAAVSVCQRAVQTVAIGEDIFYPTEFEYNRLVSLYGDYCYFASSFLPDYDPKKYMPDYSQNELLNDKVNTRFAKFDSDKQVTKKHIIENVEAYNDILSECDKALTFTYKSCFCSLCRNDNKTRRQLLKDGVRYLYRFLTPFVKFNDKKKAEIKLGGKFVDLVDKYNMLTEFLTEADGSDNFVRDSLRGFYERICDVIELYFLPEYEKHTKIVNKLKDTKGDDYKYYERLLFDTACATAPALIAFVGFSEHKDRARAKLVKYCKQTAEEFLMLRDYHVDEIDQSNVYRPILDIYNAVMDEVDV